MPDWATVTAPLITTGKYETAGTIKEVSATGSGTLALLPHGTYTLWNWGASWTTGSRTVVVRLTVYTVNKTVDAINLNGEAASSRVQGLRVTGIVAAALPLTGTHPVKVFLLYSTG